jgi:hypothetical protein
MKFDDTDMEFDGGSFSYTFDNNAANGFGGFDVPHSRDRDTNDTTTSKARQWQQAKNRQHETAFGRGAKYRGQANPYKFIEYEDGDGDVELEAALRAAFGPNVYGGGGGGRARGGRLRGGTSEAAAAAAAAAAAGARRQQHNKYSRYASADAYDDLHMDVQELHQHQPRMRGAKSRVHKQAQKQWQNIKKGGGKKQKGGGGKGPNNNHMSFIHPWQSKGRGGGGGGGGGQNHQPAGGRHNTGKKNKQHAAGGSGGGGGGGEQWTHTKYKGQGVGKAYNRQKSKNRRNKNGK